jgi:MscS family membrane protein
VIRILVRRTESDVEDVVLDVSRRPVVVIILLLGLVDSLNALALEIDLPWVETAGRWLMASVIAVLTYWAWRLLKEVVIHYGERIAQRSETRVDDVLLPIVNQFAPIVLFIIGGSTILQYLGIRLDALLVAIGGAAFILAFALQDILSNVFSGLSLLVDTPFRYGDLVKLEDGTVCQVVKIGVRVTQLFDIDTHAVIYMPNSKLANERLSNLMQPTPELISSVRMVIARGSDVERVRQILIDILDGHPDLLGEIPTKLQRIRDFAVLPEAKRRRGRAGTAGAGRADRPGRAERHQQGGAAGDPAKLRPAGAPAGRRARRAEAVGCPPRQPEHLRGGLPGRGRSRLAGGADAQVDRDLDPGSGPRSR